MSSPSRLVAIAIVVFVFVIVVGASSSSWCHAFVAPSSRSSSLLSTSSAKAITSVSSRSNSISRTTLYGVNKRRGQLGNNVSFDDDGTVRLISNKQKQRRGSNNSSSSKKSSNKRGKGGVDGDNDVVISPLLAQWAATDMVDSPSISSSVAAFNSITDDDDDDAAVNYQVRDGTTSPQKIDVLLEEINAMLSTNNCNVPNLVANIVSLVNLGSQSSSLSSSKNNDRILLPTLKALLSSKSITRNNSRKQPPPPQQQQQQQRPPSYRLAWAGSDNAICHIGTSLHKVPLARLQEIYLTLGGDDGKNKWELLEVIRILGPFPNVRNTLRGEVTKLMKLGDGSSTSMGMKRGESPISSSGSGREGVRMEIAYNSMIDGTGKEILASGESRVKYVQLDIWYASAKALVCTTVPSSENGDDADSSNNNIGNKDPLSSSTDGSRILFFVAEENLEEQLEKLRAA